MALASLFADIKETSMRRVFLVLTLAILSNAKPTLAQQTAPEAIPFSGGTLTITPNDDLEKIVAFDGKELARNYQVGLDKIVEVAGVSVALVDVGDGGNQCGPATLIVWKPEGSGIQSLMVEQDECGAPAAAVADQSIQFVPYLMPGAERRALQWSPQEGLTLSGILSYAPEPGTGWEDIDRNKYRNVVDSFHNEAVYRAAQTLLGGSLTDVATGLLVGGGTETTPSGAFYASGCVPHACGGADSFMAIDPAKKSLYFAQQSEDTQGSTWPKIEQWPADLKAAKEQAIGQ